MTSPPSKTLTARSGVYRLPSGYQLLGTSEDNHLELIDSDSSVYGLDGKDELIISGSFNNQIFGGSGNDKLNGGSGNNLLDGGEGSDQLAGSIGDDTYVINDKGDIAIELAGQGTDEVQSSISFLLGQYLENLTLTGVQAINATGNALNNRLIGNNNNNVLDGRGGADWLQGLAGDDRYFVDAPGDRVIEADNGGTDDVFAAVSFTLSENVENLTLNGTDNNQAIGNRLSNRLVGNVGSNTLDGGAGADQMLGLAGNDIYVVDNQADSILEQVGEGIDTIQSAISYVLGANLENLTLLGNASITAAGNQLNNWLIGNSGDNILDGRSGDDRMEGGDGGDVYLVDSLGDVVIENDDRSIDKVFSTVSFQLRDYLEDLTLTGSANAAAIGNELNNVLIGNSADNRLDGKGGRDEMHGAAGDDLYVVDTQQDRIIEAEYEGDDRIESSVSFELSANVEQLLLTGSQPINAIGNDADNHIIGNDAANQINGRGGADRMEGLSGDDYYTIDNINDIVIELADAGHDVVLSSVSFSLGDNIEELRLTGVARADAIGNSLSNRLVGNVANNSLIGGAGVDQMEGQEGDDVYVVDNSGDRVVELEQAGTDRVEASVSWKLGANTENLTLLGNTAIDATGNALDNRLIGNQASNVLDGLLGCDRMEGGGGDDLYLVDDIQDRVIELADHGYDEIQTTVSLELPENVEAITLLGALSINATGNQANNILIGNGNSNILDGGDGVDRMTGNKGNDLYLVDNNADQIVELLGGGKDDVIATCSYVLPSEVENLSLSGYSANDATGNDLENHLIGTSNNNRLDGKAASDTMQGLQGDDLYIVDISSDRVEELPGEGIDAVAASVTFMLPTNVEQLILTGIDPISGTGNDLPNQVQGNQNDNRINGLGGQDWMAGGRGNDVYVVDSPMDIVLEREAEGIDEIESPVSLQLPDYVENIKLTGNTAIDATGNSLDNRLSGNGINNRLLGKQGNDIYIVSSSSVLVIEANDEGRDRVVSAVSYALPANIEELELSGTLKIDGIGNELNNVLLGNGADNQLDGKAGSDNMDGGDGDDSYTVDNSGDLVREDGDSGFDTVLAWISYELPANVEACLLQGTADINATGNDDKNILRGNSGLNILSGGLGDDTYQLDQLSDKLIEAMDGGRDTIISSLDYNLPDNFENLQLADEALNGSGNAASNKLRGNQKPNVLAGMAGNDAIDGDLGGDRIYGGDGEDMLLGGGGDDVLYGDRGNDLLDGGSGLDTADYSVMWASLKADLASGSVQSSETGIDYLTGVEGLIAGSADDILIGNQQSNLLQGGLGADILTGGSGKDSFVYTSLRDSFFQLQDRIIDFTVAEDTLLLPGSVNLTSLFQVVGDGDLTESRLVSLLPAGRFQSNNVASVTLRQSGKTQTLLIVNDAVPGFQSLGDGVINLSGVIGPIEKLQLSYAS